MEKKKRRKTGIINMLLFNLIIIISIHTTGCKELPIQTTPVNTVSSDADTTLPVHPDHIIFLWLENKGFNTIIGSNRASFINSLVKKGTLFTNTYAVTHPSYPNYIDFFAGESNGINDDACIDNSPLTTPDLYSILKGAGKSFAWYSEDLPAVGSKVCIYNNYVEKHNPTTIFANVPDSVNKRFADFPADYNQLENVVCISPNLVNDMHSGSIKQADNWIKKNVAPLADWCTSHNSVFVIYFDESETNEDNRIPVIAVGQQVKADYQSANLYDHFSWTKTICSMFSAPDAWTGNLSAAKLVTGCWK
jgi:phosphatidylinositol-3-phosphatase